MRLAWLLLLLVGYGCANVMREGHCEETLPRRAHFDRVDAEVFRADTEVKSPLLSREFWPSHFAVYRHVGHPVFNQTRTRRVVLFAHGNGGDYWQARHLFDLLEYPDTELYALHFGEELSALSGLTLSRQVYFTASVIRILSISYPGAVFVLLGHSMGGVVMRSAHAHLRKTRSIDIEAIVCIGSPMLRPVVLTDWWMHQVYRSYNIDTSDNTALLAIAGGAHDTQIDSADSRVLTGSVHSAHVVTVLTRALPQVDHSVGHQALTWCTPLISALAQALKTQFSSVDGALGASLDTDERAVTIASTWRAVLLPPEGASISDDDTVVLSRRFLGRLVVSVDDVPMEVSNPPVDTLHSMKQTHLGSRHGDQVHVFCDVHDVVEHACTIHVPRGSNGNAILVNNVASVLASAFLSQSTRKREVLLHLATDAVYLVFLPLLLPVLSLRQVALLRAAAYTLFSTASLLLQMTEQRTVSADDINDLFWGMLPPLILDTLRVCLCVLLLRVSALLLSVFRRFNLTLTLLRLFALLCVIPVIHTLLDAYAPIGLPVWLCVHIALAAYLASLSSQRLFLAFFLLASLMLTLPMALPRETRSMPLKSLWLLCCELSDVSSCQTLLSITLSQCLLLPLTALMTTLISRAFTTFGLASKPS